MFFILRHMLEFTKQFFQCNPNKVKQMFSIVGYLKMENGEQLHYLSSSRLSVYIHLEVIIYCSLV